MAGYPKSVHDGRAAALVEFEICMTHPWPSTSCLRQLGAEEGRGLNRNVLFSAHREAKTKAFTGMVGTSLRDHFCSYILGSGTAAR